MKKLLIALILLLLGYSQYAASSFVTLNEGMEEAYLKNEKLWSEYHKEAVKRVIKIASLFGKLILLDMMIK